MTIPMPGAEIGCSFVRAYPVAYAVQSVFALVMLLFAPLPGPQALIHSTVWLELLGVVVWRSAAASGRHTLVLLVLGGYIGASVLIDTQVRYVLPGLPIFAVFGGAIVAEVLTPLVSMNWRNQSSSISNDHSCVAGPRRRDHCSPSRGSSNSSRTGSRGHGADAGNPTALISNASGLPSFTRSQPSASHATGASNVSRPM